MPGSKDVHPIQSDVAMHISAHVVIAKQFLIGLFTIDDDAFLHDGAHVSIAFQNLNSQ